MPVPQELAAKRYASMIESIVAEVTGKPPVDGLALSAAEAMQVQTKLNGLVQEGWHPEATYH